MVYLIYMMIFFGQHCDIFSILNIHLVKYKFAPARGRYAFKILHMPAISRDEIIHTDYGMPLSQQSLRQMTPYKPRATCDENVHLDYFIKITNTPLMIPRLPMTFLNVSGSSRKKYAAIMTII